MASRFFSRYLLIFPMCVANRDFGCPFRVVVDVLSSYKKNNVYFCNSHWVFLVRFAFLHCSVLGDLTGNHDSKPYHCHGNDLLLPSIKAIFLSLKWKEFWTLGLLFPFFLLSERSGCLSRLLRMAHLPTQIPRGNGIFHSASLPSTTLSAHLLSRAFRRLNVLDNHSN